LSWGWGHYYPDTRLTFRQVEVIESFRNTGEPASEVCKLAACTEQDVIDTWLLLEKKERLRIFQEQEVRARLMRRQEALEAKRNSHRIIEINRPAQYEIIWTIKHLEKNLT
jgi:hypothetical protein